jgi:hypothetical protein
MSGINSVSAGNVPRTVRIRNVCYNPDRKSPWKTWAWKE